MVEIGNYKKVKGSKIIVCNPITQQQFLIQMARGSQFAFMDD